MHPWQRPRYREQCQDLRGLCRRRRAAIEPASKSGADEELRAVGVLASVCHGECTGSSVLEFEVLVSELVTVDGLSSSSVATGEVTTLDHEVLDDTVEFGSLVSKAEVLAILGLASGESSEVLDGLGDGTTVKTHDDTSKLLVTMFNVKVNFVGDFGSLDGFD